MKSLKIGQKHESFVRRTVLHLRSERARGEGLPGETFRVLNEKEERVCGEYRTRRLVLEAWDRQNDKR